MAVNVNLKGCEIKIKIGDEIKIFRSDRELDDYIYNHRATLEAMLDGKIDKTFAQIEGAFESVVIDNINKALVLLDTVVIAECNNLELTVFEYHFHNRISFKYLSKV